LLHPRDAGSTGHAVDREIYASGVGVFGNKKTILKELVDVSVAGDYEPLPTLQRPWVLDVIEELDAARHVRLQVRNARKIHERVSPVLEVVRKAATVDEEIEALWETNKQQRLTVQGHLLARLRQRAA
jgi:hypothetical protein